ncbi:MULTISPECIES: hypothetical protein [unclassified Streptomyces]|uniref:hypothetical protein n=1 Tax=unclassified Streptomyces TaxID=2593676 RepID=UPI002250D3F6|nr:MULTISPECIES: hypothetical protein [unclassified Streptomyces]MCX5140765.1 hypothetical protein [Streptomyces sp. NBC_00338]WRZ65288.1 hypothetical protein OG408_15970 [Streptomyces sp. NBC_01257]WSU59288.1 hypothetical protein OG450_16155 [Streptomyces sp. NBC_01104]
MNAPGYPPTAPRRIPTRAWIVSMRVLFTVLSVFSCGLLLWAPLLRLAIVRRRTSDWWLTGAGFVLICVLLPVIGRDGSDTDAHGVDYVLIPLLLLAMVAAPTHYLVADIRHYAELTRQHTMGGPGMPGGPVPPVPGYGYAPTVPIQTPGPAPAPQPYPPHPYPGPNPTPPPDRQPHTAPQPQRLDQVRAELDELSDYLRKEEGR